MFVKTLSEKIHNKHTAKEAHVTKAIVSNALFRRIIASHSFWIGGEAKKLTCCCHQLIQSPPIPTISPPPPTERWDLGPKRLEDLSSRRWEFLISRPAGARKRKEKEGWDEGRMIFHFWLFGFLSSLRDVGHWKNVNTESVKNGETDLEKRVSLFV